MSSDRCSIDDLTRARQHHRLVHQSAHDRIEVFIRSVVVHRIVFFMLRSDILRWTHADGENPLRQVTHFDMLAEPHERFDALWRMADPLEYFGGLWEQLFVI